MTAHSASPANFGQVVRAVVWNQMLWTAGHALTSGGFLLYFANELGSQGFTTAILLALPELVGVSAIATRPLVRWLGRRKAVWAGCGLLARVAALGIPWMAFPTLRPSGVSPLSCLIVALAVSQFLQAISYVAYLSWLSDLAPQTHWGRFFATRNLARIAVQMIVPVAAGFARDWWRTGLSPDAALWAYVAAFAVGTGLQLASMAPLFRLPDVRPTAGNLHASPSPTFAVAAEYRLSLLFALMHAWWLAAANGLTQAAFFQFRTRSLGISLGTYYLLENTMLAAMIPVSVAAGRLSDRRGNTSLLIGSLLVAALAMPFWFFASRERWWLLFGAQLLWGAFAAANLAGYNLLLRLSPRGNNTLQLALFQQGGGLVAGLSGLLGGWWLDRLRADAFHAVWGGFEIDAFRLLFVISFLGRITAPLWLIPAREPPATTGDSAPHSGIAEGERSAVEIISSRAGSTA